MSKNNPDAGKEVNGRGKLRLNTARYPSATRGELWGVATYFNPAAYPNKAANLRIFSESVRSQGLRLAVVELAFDSQPYILEDSIADRVIRRRSSTILWHKERLLNLAFETLPDQCDRVAWLDADILFENDEWVAETAELLQEYVVVQPFDTAWWLLPGCNAMQARTNLRLHSEGAMFGAAYCEFSQQDEHRSTGFEGFAWAARRSLLEAYGLYDRGIIGGGDTAIAMAVSGRFAEPAIKELLRQTCTEAHASDFLAWAGGFHAAARNSVYFTNGAVFHLWHGRSAGRSYTDRHKILKDADFNPGLDIAIDENGCWRWSSDKPDLHANVKNYFWARKEDPMTVG